MAHGGHFGCAIWSLLPISESRVENDETVTQRSKVGGSNTSTQGWPCSKNRGNRKSQKELKDTASVHNTYVAVRTTRAHPVDLGLGNL